MLKSEMNEVGMLIFGINSGPYVICAKMDRPVLEALTLILS